MENAKLENRAILDLPCSRRGLMFGAAALAGLTLGSEKGLTKETEVYEDLDKLKPGEFIWHPERSPAGPVALVVSLSSQLLSVYRNGIRIGVSTCSTGKPGHLTPSGIFFILTKDKDHHSSLYNDAPMPYNERLTWDGIAIHAGNLPGYPASHGCVRLPFGFAKLLFGVTHLGTPVVISDAYSSISGIAHPGIVLGETSLEEFAEMQSKTAIKMLPDPQGVAFSVLVSGADKEMLLLENGRIIDRGPVFLRDPETPLGERIFVLQGSNTDKNSLVWHAVSYQQDGFPFVDQTAASVIPRIEPEKRLAEEIRTKLHTGTVLVVTDLPLTPQRRSGKDFVIVTQGDVQ